MKYDRHKIYYVYALLDPRKPGPFRYGRWKFSHEPFYIGKGKNNRIKTHCSSSNLKGRSLKVLRIKEIYADGCAPIEVVKRAELTEKQAFTLEAFFIEKIGRLDRNGGILLNANAGWTGVSPSERVRKHIGRNAKRMHRNFSEEQKSSRGAKIGSGQSAYWEKLRQDPKAYAARCNKQRSFANMSKSDMDKIRKKMSNGRKVFFKSLSEKERLEKNRKTAEAVALAWQKRKVLGTNKWYSS